MEKIKFMFDYGCVPVWVISGEGGLICTGVPEDLTDNKELVQLLDDLATEHMNLFINNDIEFTYKGFSNKEEEIAFNNKVYRTIELLKLVDRDKYVIEVDYEFC